MFWSSIGVESLSPINALVRNFDSLNRVNEGFLGSAVLALSCQLFTGA